GEWHTGEVVGVGTLRCKACGELLHFHATGHIPPCPKCQKTVFNRVSHSD
ncbi:MAG: zinc ribbon-containing protein, partial [Gammaproteobacteria bacterium]|nr:zinc ribbon-containing protein [Gammaproteobacteria bacterium]